LIRIENLTVQFGSRKVLDQLNLELTDHEITVVLGRSGIGKSVLLKAILGLVPIVSGKIWFNDEELRTAPVRRRTELLSQVGMLLQNGGLFDSMNVYENIAFPLRYHQTASGNELDRIVREQAELVGLTDALLLEPSDLSGGMKRRAALARCLVQNPTFLFYDEPTAGLDPGTSALVETLIRHVSETRGLAAVVVTHDLDLVRYLGDRVALLDSGKIVACQSRDQALVAGSPIWERFITAREKIHRGQSL